jgi:hypothetical protein
MVIELKLIQFEKAEKSISVTVFGIFTETKLEQFSNRLNEILVILFGSTTFSRLEQFAKTSLPSSVTESESEICFKAVHL